MATQGSAALSGSVAVQAAGRSKDRVIALAGAATATDLPEATCPLCQRIDALVRVGEAWYCAACGYASDGAAGCT